MKRPGGFARAVAVAQAVFALAGCDGELVVQASDPPEELCEAGERPVSVEWEVTVRSAPDAGELLPVPGVLVAHRDGNVSVFSRARFERTSEGLLMGAGLSWTTLAPNGDVVADRTIDGPLGPDYAMNASVGPDGTAAVRTAASWGPAISTYDDAGKQLGTVQLPSGTGGYADVAFDARSNLVMLTSQSLQRYKTDGTLLSSVDLTLGLAMSSVSRLRPLNNGDVLAATLYADYRWQIVRINPTGELVWEHRTAGTHGTFGGGGMPMQDYGPGIDIAIGSSYEAHVTIFETTRFTVAKLDESGATSWEWHSPPPQLDPRQVGVPAWIRVDRRGYRYVWVWQPYAHDTGEGPPNLIYRFRPDGELCGVSYVPGLSCDTYCDRSESFAVGPSGEMTVLVATEAGDLIVRRVK